MKLDWWTLALQTINVLVLLWVLQRFLFKPVVAIISQRREATERMMADAAAAGERAAQARASLENERSALEGARDQALAAARAEAQKEREALLAQVREELSQVRAGAQASLERERAEAAADLRIQAAALAVDLTRRLLERLPHVGWNRHFIEAACRMLAELPPEESVLLHRGPQEAGVEVASADRLAAEDQAFAQTSVRDALGAQTPVTFSVDPRLLAGIELRFRHLVIRNHLAADLEKMQEHLLHDEHTARAA